MLHTIPTSLLLQHREHWRSSDVSPWLLFPWNPMLATPVPCTFRPREATCECGRVFSEVTVFWMSTRPYAMGMCTGGCLSNGKGISYSCFNHLKLWAYMHVHPYRYTFNIHACTSMLAYIYLGQSHATYTHKYTHNKQQITFKQGCLASLLRRLHMQSSTDLALVSTMKLCSYCWKTVECYTTMFYPEYKACPPNKLLMQNFQSNSFGVTTGPA